MTFTNMFSLIQTVSVLFVLVRAVRCSSVSVVRYSRRANEYITCTPSCQIYTCTVLSALDCARMCDKDGNCHAVNYNRLDNTCELLSILPSQFGVSTTTSSQWTAYHIPDITGVCDLGWYQYDVHCYMYNDDRTSWEKARQSCQASQADLADIADSAENMFVSDLATNYTTTSFWIGLNDIDVENDWKWVSGSTSTFRQFHPGEPSNGMGIEDCVASQFRGPYNWNDCKCSTLLPSVCKQAINI